MRSLLATFLFLILGHSHAHAAFYKVLVCEGGNVWVDVNSEKRTELQLISRHQQANRHLLQQLGAHANYQTGSASEAGWLGTQGKGVFAKSDFKGATMVSVRPDSAHPQELNGGFYRGYTEYVSFFMIDATTLKVQVDRGQVTKCLDDAYNGLYGVCAEGTEYLEYEYGGDYLFRGCHIP